MPRVADHDQRRAQIAAAFRRLLAADGFAAVTFSRLAAEAGISVGLIQHYFAGKDELLRFAYEDAIGRMSERVRAHLGQAQSTRLPIADTLLGTLAELLPLDAERAAEYRVRQGLQTQALHDPELFELARRSGGDMLGYVVSMIESGRHCGEVAPDADAALGARAILATLQGLADQLTLSGVDAFDAVGALRSVVALVFTGPCRSHGG